MKFKTDPAILITIDIEGVIDGIFSLSMLKAASISKRSNYCDMEDM